MSSIEIPTSWNKSIFRQDKRELLLVFCIEVNVLWGSDLSGSGVWGVLADRSLVWEVAIPRIRIEEKGSLIICHECKKIREEFDFHRSAADVFIVVVVVTVVDLVAVIAVVVVVVYLLPARRCQRFSRFEFAALLPVLSFQESAGPRLANISMSSKSLLSRSTSTSSSFKSSYDTMASSPLRLPVRSFQMAESLLLVRSFLFRGFK